MIGGDNLFFRLRTFCRREEPRQLILDSQIWFSDVGHQDDIYEGRPRVQWRGPKPTVGEVRATLGIQLRHLPSEDREREINAVLAMLADDNLWEIDKAWIVFEIEKWFLGSSICSFFPDYLNARSWAQYAANGTGYCLVFNFSQQWRLLATHKGPPIPMRPAPVIYTRDENRPVVNVSGSVAPAEEAIEEVRGALLTKSHNWAEQREHRLIRVGVQAGLVDFPVESLEGVIFGYDIDRNDRQMLLDLSAQRTKPLQFHSVRRSPSGYALELVEFNP